MRVTDGVFDDAVLDLHVVDINERPYGVRLIPDSISESASPMFPVEVEALDVDASGAYGYDLVDGIGTSDNALFVRNGTTLHLVGSLNFEQRSTLSLVIRIRDGPHIVDLTSSLTVRDANDPPYAVELVSSSVRENSAPGTVVSPLYVRDEDVTSLFRQFVVQLQDDASGRYSVADNQLVVLSATDFDYETLRVHNITVVVDGVHSSSKHSQ